MSSGTSPRGTRPRCASISKRVPGPPSLRRGSGISALGSWNREMHPCIGRVMPVMEVMRRQARGDHPCEVCPNGHPVVRVPVGADPLNLPEQRPELARYAVSECAHRPSHIGPTLQGGTVRQCSQMSHGGEADSAGGRGHPSRPGSGGGLAQHSVANLMAARVVEEDHVVVDRSWQLHRSDRGTWSHELSLTPTATRRSYADGATDCHAP